MLSLIGITKRFDGITALSRVEAMFTPGRVHGVLGENGAGKTTLMRIAAGLLRPDEGSIRLDNRELDLSSSLDAARAGIAMVHQHFMLVPTLTVAENCLLGRRDLGRWVSRRRAAREIEALSRRIGLPVDPSARIDSLSVGERQRVEIVRALGVAARMLILDEPTAVLAPQETEQLFEAIDRLRRDGLAIAFISHKLDEVSRICDELTILRRGRRVHHGPAADLSTAQMAEHMVGTRIAPLPRHPSPPADTPAVLQLVDVHARDVRSPRQLSGVNLTLRAGEILGIAGVEGNGQDLLAAVIVGLVQPAAGQVRIDDRDVTHGGVRTRQQAGLAHIAEDRLAQALVPAMSLRENLILKNHAAAAFARAGLIGWGRVHTHAVDLLSRFDVRAASPLVEARHLSGGNQQKVVLARELSGSPRLVVAHNPVRGLDVAATRFVFEQLLAQRQHGAGVLLIHSDLDELLNLADRVVVLFGGRCIPTDWPACDRAAIGRIMLGGTA